MYAQDLVGQNFMDARTIFTKYIYHPIHFSTMSYNHMLLIKAMISSNNPNTCTGWQKSISADFREVFDKFNKAYAQNISPEDFKAINETLYSTRDRVFSKLMTRVIHQNMA